MGLADLIPDDADAAFALFGGLSLVTILLGLGVVLGFVDQGTFMDSAVADIEWTIKVAVAISIFGVLGGFTVIKFFKQRV